MNGDALKIRLDDLLVKRGLAQDRPQAQALILAGSVLVAGRPAMQAGVPVLAAAEIRLKGETCPYVSRGGTKLQRALEAFEIEVTDLIALDVGASTGGFTDCLLQAGAAKVYALDVAYGQLAWKLRTDQRVVILERTNIRFYNGAEIDDPIDLAVIDASFISLKVVLPPVLRLIRDGALVVALVKPQFEVAKGEVGPGGVVRDPEQHRQVLVTLEKFCREWRLAILGCCESPLLGAAGNKEFFLCLRKPPA